MPLRCGGYNFIPVSRLHKTSTCTNMHAFCTQQLNTSCRSWADSGYVYIWLWVKHKLSSQCPLMSQHQVTAWHWWWIAMIFSVYLHAISQSYDSHCDIFLFATYTGLGWWWEEWPLAANEEVTTPDQQQTHAAWPHHLSLSWSLYPLQCSLYP